MTTATHSQKSRRPFYVLMGVLLSVPVMFGINYYAGAAEAEPTPTPIEATPSASPATGSKPNMVVGTGEGKDEAAALSAAKTDAANKCVRPDKTNPELGRNVYQSGGQWVAWYAIDCGGGASTPGTPG